MDEIVQEITPRPHRDSLAHSLTFDYPSLCSTTTTPERGLSDG